MAYQHKVLVPLIKNIHLYGKYAHPEDDCRAKEYAQCLLESNPDVTMDEIYTGECAQKTNCTANFEKLTPEEQEEL